MLLKHYKLTLYRTAEPIVYVYRGVIYVVPVDFEFNGASIPPIFWSLLFLHPLHHRVARAALLHDYMYHKGLGKEIADRAFKSLMKEDGCNVYQRQLAYWAVRLFGHNAYREAHRGE